MVKGKASSTPESVQVLRTIVASSARSVWKLWIGVPSSWHRRATFAFAPTERSAGATGSRVALAALVLVGKEQFAPGLLQMPFDIVGEHAEEDVGADSVAQTVMDGADLEVDGLQGAEGALDLREGFVVAHAACAIETFRCDRGADDGDAIEGRLRGNGVFLAGKGHARVSDRQTHVLGHLVAIHDAAYGHTDDRAMESAARARSPREA